MTPIPSQKKSLLYEVLLLLVLSAALAGGMNYAAPAPLPWLGSGMPASAPQDTASMDGGVSELPTIDTARAMELAATGEAVFVDARYPADYEAGHLPGAVNVPPGLFDDEIGAVLEPELHPGAVLVVYCQSPSCPLAHETALGLDFMGYEGIVVYPGGWEQWTAAGGETEVSR